VMMIVRLNVPVLLFVIVNLLLQMNVQPNQIVHVIQKHVNVMMFFLVI
jgi:hypothetical protein